jgi:hypothetical protein
MRCNASAVVATAEKSVFQLPSDNSLTPRQKFSSDSFAPFLPPLQQRGRVHRASAGATDALDGEIVFLQQAVEHAPGERTVGSAALQREVDGFG